MPSYLWYKKCLDRFIESEHPRDADGKFTDAGGTISNSNIKENNLSDFINNELQNTLKNALLKIAAGKNIISSRRVEAGIKKIHLQQTEAIKCAEAIEKYTQNAKFGDRNLINKAIHNSDSYNGKTYSGVEQENDRSFNIGDEISGRLISWSKDEKTAMGFAKTKKILIIEKNPGLDISDISYEPQEQEVLTASDMKFIVTHISEKQGIKKIFVEYKS